MLQPFFYFLIAKIYYFFGAKDPFHLATIWRFITATMAFGAGLFYLKTTRDEFSPKWHKLYYALYALIWFFPFFHARTTTENFGSTFFMIGLSFMLLAIRRQNDKRFLQTTFLASTFCTLAFCFRYQFLISLIPLLLWGISQIRQEKRISCLGLLLLGFLLPLGSNFLSDYWGYGSWTLSPWNYFYQNIIQGKASHFGVDPWWKYIEKIVTRGIPPLGLGLLFCLVWCWIKRPKHYLTWITFPFFLVHSLIGHKEIRFLFPLAFCLPTLMLIAWSSWNSQRFRQSKIFSLFLALSLAQSAILLPISSLRPAFAPISFYKHLYYKIGPQITEIYTLAEFRDQLRFYLHHPIKQILEEDWERLTKLINKATPKQPHWFLTNRLSDIERFRDFPRCRQSFQSYPDWMLKISIGKWPKQSKIWALYQCI